jgi:DinB superfamily
MRKVDTLILQVKEARDSYCKRISSISETQAQWKPSPDVWNVIEITEHLYWAEQGGIAGMWKTLYAIRSGQLEKRTDSVHQNLTVEEIVARTWKEKEQVPPVAAPRQGGVLIYWRHALASLQLVLEGFGKDIQDDELRLQAHPHPISGAMDFQQRLEFLTFHIRRHESQVERLQQLYKST